MNNTKTTLKLRKVRRVLAAGAILAAMGGGLHATTRTASATDSGLGFYPTADIYPDGNFHFDYDTFGKGLKTNVGTSVGLEYGFGKGGDGVFGRNEIGVDYLVSAGAGGFPFNSADERIAANFKTQLYNNDKSGVRLAAGVAGIGSRRNFGVVDARLLAYKAFPFGRVHAGLWRGFGRATGVDDTGGLQLGVDKVIGKWVLGADWRTGPTGFLAPCAIWNFNDKADFEFCVGHANNDGVAPRWQTYLAFDYNFDFKKK